MEQGALLIIDRILLSLLALASVPFEGPSGETHFQVQGVQFSMTIPNGLCATESFGSNSLIQAVSGGAGKVAAAFVGCGANQKPTIVVFAPDVGTTQIFDREEVLDGLALAYTAPSAPKYDPQLQQYIEEKYSKEAGRKISSPGFFGYAGRDLDCVYLGGNFYVKIEDRQPLTEQVGACFTAIGGKILFVYAVGGKSSTIPELQAIARDAAMTIQKRD